MNRKDYLDEEWRPIKDYEGLYMVSNYGRVKSLNYGQVKGAEKILQTTAMKGHYIKVGLSKNGKMRYFRIHRLVAIAFLPPPTEGQTQVDHMVDKQDNRVQSIRWCTPKENMNNTVTKQHISEGHKNPSTETRARMSAGQKRRFERERETNTGRYAHPVGDRF